MVFKLDLTDMERHKVELRLYLDKARRRFKQAQMADDFETIVGNMLKNDDQQDPNQALSVHLERMSIEGCRRLLEFLQRLVALCNQEDHHRMLQDTLRRSLLNSVKLANPDQRSCYFCCQEFPLVDMRQPPEQQQQEVPMEQQEQQEQMPDQAVLMLQPPNPLFVPASQETPVSTPFSSPRHRNAHQFQYPVHQFQPEPQDQPEEFQDAHNVAPNANEQQQNQDVNTNSAHTIDHEGMQEGAQSQDLDETAPPMQIDEDFIPNASQSPAAQPNVLQEPQVNPQSMTPPLHPSSPIVVGGAHQGRTITLMNPIAKVKADLSRVQENYYGPQRGANEMQGNRIEQAVSRIKLARSSTPNAGKVLQSSKRNLLEVKIKSDLLSSDDTESDNDTPAFYSPIAKPRKQQAAAAATKRKQELREPAPVPAAAASSQDEMSSVSFQTSYINRTVQMASASFSATNSSQSQLRNVLAPKSQRGTVLLNHEDLPHIRHQPVGNSIKRASIKTKRVPKRRNK